ncbi:MAG: transglycosylase domain-containing protein [Gemmatimonadales bacterium]|nr:transglycosylase domain-containing protein [Gemmatimonadales bacterium]
MTKADVAQPAGARTRRMVRRTFWLALAVTLLAGMMLLADIALTWIRYGPRIDALADSVPETTAYMARRARDGQPPLHHRWVPLDSMPMPVVCAALAAENIRFFDQGTLDWAAQRGLLNRMLHGDFSRGSSGIAQQLARNLFLSPDRTLRRKLREYILAYKISHTLTKERQLELYLNLIEWGDQVWGVAAGSEQVMQRPLHQLRPSEIVLLVSVLPAPSRGLEYASSHPRRFKPAVVAEMLWREGILDYLDWGATTARFRRTTDFIDLGMTPHEAARAVTEEMGEELVLEADGAHPASVRESCDPKRRGVS